MRADSLESLTQMALAASCGTDQELLVSGFARRLAAGRDDAEPELLRGLLGQILGINADRIDRLRYPKPVRKLIKAEFEKIREFCDRADGDEFTLESHFFRSQLRIAGLGRIPVGPEHLEIDGAPRNLLYRGGLNQSRRFLSMLAEMRALRPHPMFVLHLRYGIPDSGFLLVYSPKAQRRMFLRLAQCLELNPRIRGVTAAAWWYDPTLAEHSPHLSYLRQGCLEIGASFFFYQAGPVVVELATRNSPARRQLVEEGSYRPRSFLFICTRARLLQWAARQSDS